MSGSQRFPTAPCAPCTAVCPCPQAVV